MCSSHVPETPQWYHKAQRGDVDRQTKFPQRPSSGREGCAVESSPYETGDGDEVAAEDGDSSETVDGVQGSGRAEIDAGEERGCDEGDEDRAERNVPAWCDVGYPGRAGDAVVSCERPVMVEDVERLARTHSYVQVK